MTVCVTAVSDTNSRAPGRLLCVENPGMNGLEGGVLSTVGTRGIDGGKVFYFKLNKNC